jgi:hypothetical protein
MARLAGRRGRRSSPRAVWVFRIPFTDPEGEQIWDATVSMVAELSRRPQASRVSTRALLDPDQFAIQDRLRSEAGTVLRQLNDSLGHAVQLWLARERGIVAELTSKHARLSAVLLQPALFFSGPHRLAASQEQALNDAVAGCQQRLSELHSLTNARAGSSELLLAALLA